MQRKTRPRSPLRCNRRRRRWVAGWVLLDRMHPGVRRKGAAGRSLPRRPPARCYPRSVSGFQTLWSSRIATPRSATHRMRRAFSKRHLSSPVQSCCASSATSRARPRSSGCLRRAAVAAGFRRSWAAETRGTHRSAPSYRHRGAGRRGPCSSGRPAVSAGPPQQHLATHRSAAMAEALRTWAGGAHRKRRRQEVILRWGRWQRSLSCTSTTARHDS
mmetsp:Transcript_117545/g.374528  ORF Transcript_117545/g.374528 Transcript_117545/m.374528 type:complete len:216 (-) Transcript_117545:714-1361(-)